VTVETTSGSPLPPRPEVVLREPLPSVFVGDVELRPSEFEALVGGRRTGLTRREFQILECLARRPDRVITRQEVYEDVWGGVMPHRDRSVDVFVRKVRAKLAAVAPDRVFIHTHFGVGYRWAPQPISSPSAGDGPARHEP
jgi:DNA-binding response OmpR family regulator